MESKVIQIDQVGGPENMKYRSVNLPEPGKGQVIVKHENIGLNYITPARNNQLVFAASTFSRK